MLLHSSHEKELWFKALPHQLYFSHYVPVLFSVCGFVFLAWPAAPNLFWIASVALIRRQADTSVLLNEHYVLHVFRPEKAVHNVGKSKPFMGYCSTTLYLDITLTEVCQIKQDCIWKISGNRCYGVINPIMKFWFKSSVCMEEVRIEVQQWVSTAMFKTK